jgi:acyl-CoA synthetase (AMP-forming)/AMP-acid ligase II/lysophospholipase L1-like esterase
MKVVCFGDSLTSCGGANGRYSDILQDRFPAHNFVNRGVGGNTFVDGLARLQSDVLDEQPDIVLIELGANDWWRNERPYTDWGKDLESCITQVQRQGAMAVVVGVFGPYRDADGNLVEKDGGTDERGAAFYRLEAEIAARYGCPYVANHQERIYDDRRCWSDSNHPNEYGNRFVADTIEPILEELLATPALPVRKPTLFTTRDFWQEAVALAPDRLAVVDGDRRLTYREADAQIERLAAGLAAVTGTSSPKVAVHLPNSLEYYLVYWAVQKLGGVIVPLNTWLKEESLAGIFRTVEPDLLILRRPQERAVLRAAQSGKPIPIFSVEESPVLPPFANLLASTAPLPAVEIGPDDLSIIMHTSGTTATPKGAMMRHSDLMFNVAAAINAHDFSTDDVHLLVNPMFHCTALYSSLPTAAYQKTPVIIVGTTLPEELLALVERERITTFLSVPSVFQTILMQADIDNYDTSSLRVMAYAGSPMPVAVIHQLRERFPNVALHNFFGLTETISMTHVLRNADCEAHPDSIGRLLPFVEARVVDEQDKEVPPGTPGELLFAREEVIPGYYKQPERLQEAIAEIDGRRWFRTGDLAMVDDEGFFYIKGRKKDMIIVGGENVFAAEVEAVLLTHPQVREAAVKGVPATGIRAPLGELIRAYVVPGDPALTEQELRRHCVMALPSYKVPSIFTFLTLLPRNPSGKVVKDELPE